jgi:hypothetical protein
VPAPSFTVSGPRRGYRRVARRGQSLVEFTLLLPVLVLIFLAVVDFARLFASMVAVESAAREAADYGTLYPWHWEPANIPTTVAEMERRACVAASNLPEYVGPDDDCANPSFSYVLVAPAGVTEEDCWQVPRENAACRVEVTLSHTFRLIAPLNIQFFDIQIGLPTDLSFERTSVFAVSDFDVDEPPVAP